MASFTKQIKDEVTKIETNKLESIAEVNGFLLLNTNNHEDKITIYIENNSVARRIFSLIKRIYNININLTIRTQKRFNVKTISSTSPYLISVISEIYSFNFGFIL